jgi:hypothetical protein
MALTALTVASMLTTFLASLWHGQSAIEVE